MSKLYSMFAACGAAVITLVSVFWYALAKGKQEKEAEIIKKGVEDAMQTKQREDDRRSDSIDDVAKRMRKYTD